MRSNFRTYQLSVSFYHGCVALKLPSHLRNQLDRAASSVSLNLAEGSGRSSKKEQRRFYDIAFASLRECQAVLDLVLEPVEELKDLADKLAAHLYCLIKALA
ncbi:MAG: four helix bundle protein [Bdellovibrionales bacterium]|nr:four helix bundle protein [Bdellovibrionales bacterium]